MKFKKYDIEWNDKNISRLWDYYSNQGDTEYFSELYGREILKITLKHVSFKKKKLLDYGSGRGGLLQHILDLKLNLKYNALDFSKKSIQFLNKKYINNKVFEVSEHIESLPSTFVENYFDIVTLLEVIEHLNKDHLNDSLQEIGRVIKTNGILIVTTPNNENLSVNENFCPDCGCTFHKWQHVNSFSSETIVELMEKHDFKLEALVTTNFAFNTTIFKKMYFSLRNFVKKSSNHPHLLYIGRKI